MNNIFPVCCKVNQKAKSGFLKERIYMKRLSFKTQIYISFAIIICAFALGQFFKIGILHNIGWIFIGLLFLINPVWPKAVDWRNHDELKKGIRIGSVLVIILFGFLIRYGV